MIRRGFAIFVTALVLTGAVFFTALAQKDRWIWRWAEARVHDVWPGVRLSCRVHAFNLFGIVLEGLEAAGRDRKDRSVVLKGGTFYADRQGAVLSLRRFEFADAAVDGSSIFVSFDLGSASARAGAFIHRLSRGKAEVTDVTARGRVVSDRVFLDAFTCAVFGGTLKAQGEGVKDARGISSFEITLNLSNIDAQKALRAFAPEAKFELSGSFSGDVSLVIEEGRLKAVQGLLASTSGGRMIVTDTSVFQGVKATTAANLVVENLKDYHYDNGDVTLGLEGADLKLDMELAGAGGTRQLTVVFHGEDDGQP